MTMPQRVQQSHAHGKPENTVSVARPTKWGNPFLLGDVGRSFPSLTTAQRQGFVVNQFKDLLASPRLREKHGYPSLAEIRTELAGKNLACYCPIGTPCHADVLIEVANGGTE